ncbi:glycoside hydrolase superfamily [Gorgonomyces haynaldii]|nr:glycoside hydrolase superfamily [Gorgonomyces haynaldii]
MLSFVAAIPTSPFAVTEGTRFYADGQPLFVFSANYWQAMNLGAPDAAAGNRTRLLRDLDKLQSFGVNHLRIMAASEGPDTEPFRMTPSLMPAPGVYNQDVLDGLDFAMAEIGKRGMKATLCMNNYWQWSGGFAQYVSWVSNTSIPYPPSWDPKRGDYTPGDYSEFVPYSGRFYNDNQIKDKAQALYRDHLKAIITRTNKYTGKQYKEDPAIFAWQLANEPQNPSFQWVSDTARFIRSLDQNHLVSVGLESKNDQQEFMDAHNHPEIDYATVHIWAQNRGIYNMLDSSESNIANAVSWALGWVQQANDWSQSINKPMILEEFGLARDNWVAQSQQATAVYNPNNPTTHKDRYYKALLERAAQLYKSGAYGGFGFWAYAGESRPGDKWVSDPPHEAPGWYSVYDKDQSTIQVMKQAFDLTKHYYELQK